MEKAKALIEKYKAGLCNNAERQLIDRWLFEIHAGESSDLDAEDFERIQTEIWGYVETNKRKRKLSKLWPSIAAAAAVLLVIGAGLFFYNRYANTPGHSKLLSGSPGLANQVKPGGNKAYLTLANGKKLSLSDAANGALAQEAGVEISKTADGQIVYQAPGDNRLKRPGQYSNTLNTIETPKGGQYQVRLPDGSKVWLNAASKLIYPVSFKGREKREVELIGEAYFEIYKDRMHPFHVKTAGQDIEVLGTHFNVNSYPDETDTRTTLLEGSVKLYTAQIGVVLKPGQQAILKNMKIRITIVNAQDAVAWKDGYFVFHDEKIESILRKLSRWYNIEVEYDGKVPDILFEGKMRRSLELSQVLKALEAVDVHFTLTGDKLIVKP